MELRGDEFLRQSRKINEAHYVTPQQRSQLDQLATWLREGLSDRRALSAEGIDIAVFTIGAYQLCLLNGLSPDSSLIALGAALAKVKDGLSMEEAFNEITSLDDDI